MGTNIKGSKKEITVYRYVTHHLKRDLMGIAKSIDPGQPVQSMQADQSRNFRYWQIFLYIKC